MVHCSLAINPASSPCITACVKNKIVKCMVDTGATVSLFQKTAWSQMEGVNCSLAPWEGHKLVGVEGSPAALHRLPEAKFCHTERRLPHTESGRYLGSIT